MVEHIVHIDGVTGSSPVATTTNPRSKGLGSFSSHCSFVRILDGRTVVLAGFMRIVKPKLLAAFPNRVLNIHPALLPAFPGVHSWTQALDYGCKVAGVTVHFVDAGTDSGPIIVQKAVPVLEDDTPETLHARIQVQEHIAFPEALNIIASGKYRVEGRRVIIG